MKLPNEIKKLLTGQEYSLDRVGMSDSSVLLFPDRVLKIQKTSEESEREYRMMQWMQGRLPVPEVLAYAREGGESFLLMSRCVGRMSCSEEFLGNPDALVPLLAEALKNLWAVDVRDCPCDCRLCHKLAVARYNVEHGLVDLENVEPGTFGEGGFESPAALLDWLCENQPPEELVLSHGDFCLPNIFLEQGRVSGYIDLGRMGIADKWQDIALCYRSLGHNLDGKYQPRKDPGEREKAFKPEKLFECLGITPDQEKLRYYILLDELF